MVDPFVALVLGGIGGFVAGVVMAWVKPMGEANWRDWEARQKEARARRRVVLERAWEMVVNWNEVAMTATLAEVADPRLTAAVNSARVEADAQRRTDLRDTAKHRVGELMNEEERAASAWRWLPWRS